MWATKEDEEEVGQLDYDDEVLGEGGGDLIDEEQSGQCDESGVEGQRHVYTHFAMFPQKHPYIYIFLSG